MLVTDLAYREMEAGADGLVQRLVARVRKLTRRPMAVPAVAAVPVAPTLHLVAGDVERVARTLLDEDDRLRWRRHPQLRGQPRPVPDSEDLERGARSAAIRGLFLARSGRFEEARQAFGIAADDAGTDLTAIPGFWELSRGGMVAAVGAYEDAGRFREAANLSARIRVKYRPRTVAALPVVPARRSAT